MKNVLAEANIDQVWGVKGKILIAVSLILATTLIYGSDLQRLPLALLSNITSLIVGFTLGCLILSDPRHVWSVPTTYAIVFSLFHFGATFSFGMGLSIPEDIEKGFNYWFYTPYTISALLLSLIGFLACIIGVLIASILTTTSQNYPSQQITDRDLSQSLQVTGFVLLVFAISIWLINVISSGGYWLLVGSYSDYLDKARNIANNYIILSIAFGLPFLMIGPKSKLRDLGIIFFILWSLFAIPLGLRGEVLFPFCTAMVLMAKKRVLPSLKQTLILSICLLTIISTVRQVRQYGLSNLANINIDTNPVGALFELGSSLRPVSEVIKWRAYGEDFIYGSSYLAPFERMFSRITLDPTRLADQDDMRIMNVLVQTRVGPIGFSPIAEAYRNFNIIGVIIIMFLTGLLLGKLDSWAITVRREGILAVIFVQLLIQVRNDFVAIPFQSILGLLIIYISLFIFKVLQKRTFRLFHNYN